MTTSTARRFYVNLRDVEGGGLGYYIYSGPDTAIGSGQLLGPCTLLPSHLRMQGEHSVLALQETDRLLRVDGFVRVGPWEQLVDVWIAWVGIADRASEQVPRWRTDLAAARYRKRDDVRFRQAATGRSFGLP